ncbi:MAG TPA: inverse autotransporter beta domain-containing protein [Chthoniobacteraceae bacterium]|jgi:hypothetical protein|nr:inverse autotransporter beta domain-containing protein [Chthoniobacteraceae bacterium]
MKQHPLILAVCAALALPVAARAGHEVASVGDAKERKDLKKVILPPSMCEGRRGFFPENVGRLSVGGQFSEKMSGFYVDSLAGLYSTHDGNNVVFLNSRYSREDTGQVDNSTGVVFRHKVAGRDIIVGANAYYDSISSFRGTDFDQAGFGAEVLTRWVDARINYYKPENKNYTVERFHRTDVDPAPGGELVRRRNYSQYEGGLEGCEAEVGFLIPKLDRYAEVRVFAGYYRFNNPFGSDFEGFKARLEAHLLPGLIANVSYFDDTALMGGHWTADLRASVPFSFARVWSGQNPFAGFTDAFRPRPREFCERMNDMVIREHRVQTVVSGKRETRDRTTFDTNGTAVAAAGAPGGGGVPFE